MTIHSEYLYSTTNMTTLAFLCQRTYLKTTHNHSNPIFISAQ